MYLTQPVLSMIEAILIVGLLSLTVDFAMKPRLRKLTPDSGSSEEKLRRAA